MSNRQDPFDRLRRAAERPVPTADEKSAAFGRLQHAISREQQMAGKSGFKWGWRPIAILAAALTTLVVAIPFFITDPAQAALTEVAEAARVAAPLEVPEGDFIYTRSEHEDLAIRPGSDFDLPQDFVPYLLPTTRQVWRNPAERFILIHTTIGTPEFFDPQTQAAYYQAGLDRADQVGENVVEQFTEADDPVIETRWPTHPEQLLEAMEAFILENRDQTADTSQIIDLTADILRETHPSPELRSSLVQVLARQPLELKGRTATTITISHISDGQETAITLSSDGQLLSETVTLLKPDADLGLPEGTTVGSANYGQAQVVRDVPHK